MKKLNRVNVICKRAWRQKWPELAGVIRESVNKTLECEGIDIGCEVNVLCTDDEGITRLNRDFRDRDMPTDVLSFPMLEISPGDKPSPDGPGGERTLLGDIALSMERANAQAEEFGHGMKREVSYLTVHSVLHLLGYDHVEDAEQEKQMNARADRVMEALGIPR